MNRLLEIGHVVKAHGIRGEVLIKYYAESLLLLKKKVLLGRTPEDALSVEVSSFRQAGDKIFVSFSHSNDRTKAECLRGLVLYIHTQDLPALAEDEVYSYMLLGMDIYANGEYVGILEKIQDIAAQEIWLIRGINNEEMLFPAVDKFIVSIIPEDNRILIAPPIGLFDVYRKK